MVRIVRFPSKLWVMEKLRLRRLPGRIGEQFGLQIEWEIMRRDVEAAVTSAGRFV